MLTLETQLTRSQNQVENLFGSITASIDKVLSLQRQLFGEFADIGSILYTISSCILAWFCTAFKQTENARITLLAVICSNLVFERFLQQSGFHEVLPTAKTRLLLALLVALILLKTRFSYVNYEAQNHSLLKSLIDRDNQQTPIWFSKYKQSFQQPTFYS